MIFQFANEIHTLRPFWYEYGMNLTLKVGFFLILDKTVGKRLSIWISIGLSPSQILLLLRMVFGGVDPSELLRSTLSFFY